MNQLTDVARERILWEIGLGRALHDAAAVTGYARGTTRSLIKNFATVVMTSGFKLRPEFRDLDRYVTTVRLPLNGRLRAPMTATTPMPLLHTRAILAQARDEERTQALLHAALPLIRLVYAPHTRARLLELEARKEGGLAPHSCRHCAGTYGWKRHEDICVKYGLAS